MSKKNRKYLISGLIAIALIITTLFTLARNQNNEVGYNKNPEVSSKIVGSELVNASRIAPESLDDILKHADVVIIGKVDSKAMLIKKPFINDELKALEEKVIAASEEDRKLTFNISQVEVKVQEVVYGDVDSKTILFNQLGMPENDDYQTKVKNGQKMLFVLKKNDDGTYASVDFEEGLFELLDNETSLSMSKNPNIAKYDNVNQDILFNDIEDYFKKDK